MTTTSTNTWLGPITDPEERSVVAAFLAQWEVEVDAMQRGLDGLAEVAPHATIIRRMNRAAGRCLPYLDTLATLQQQNEATPS